MSSPIYKHSTQTSSEDINPNDFDTLVVQCTECLTRFKVSQEVFHSCGNPTFHCARCDSCFLASNATILPLNDPPPVLSSFKPDNVTIIPITSAKSYNTKSNVARTSNMKSKRTSSKKTRRKAKVNSKQMSLEPFFRDPTKYLGAKIILGSLILGLTLIVLYSIFSLAFNKEQGSLLSYITNNYVSAPSTSMFISKTKMRVVQHSANPDLMLYVIDGIIINDSENSYQNIIIEGALFKP